MEEYESRNPIFIILFWVLLPFAIVLTVLFGALLLGTNGGTKAESEISAEVLILKPPKDVYMWMVDPDDLLKWNSDFDEIIALTSGNFRRGSRYHVVLKDTERTNEIEVMNLRMHQLVEIKRIANGYETQEGYVLENLNQNTKVSYSATIGYRDGFHKLIGPILSYNYKKQVEKNLEVLKMLVESN